MQENLRLIMWTAVGMVAIWFIAMTINRNIFIHSSALNVGIIPVGRTDIDNRCGNNTNPNQLVEYKLNTAGQIVYLCPQGLWPIQKTVVANVISNDLRRLLGQNPKLELLYPSATAPSAANPLGITAPASVPPSTPAAVPAEPGAPQLMQPKLLRPTLQPKKTTPPPATPPQNTNPFIAEPAAH